MTSVLHRFRLRRLSIKHIATDVALMIVGLYLSLFLRTGSGHQLEMHLQALVFWTPIFLGIRLLCLVAFGSYQCMWRYVSIPDAVRLGEAAGLSMLCMISMTYFFHGFGVLPRSFFFIDAFVCLFLLMGARLIRRMLYERNQAPTTSSALSQVLIYGAGSTGRMFAQRIAGNPTVRVIGFLDDDPKKSDKSIHGISVLGSGSDLENLMQAIRPTDLVVAIRRPGPDLLRNLVLLGRKYKVKPQVLSEVEAKGFWPKSKSLYREIELKDLLNRPSVGIDTASVQAMIEGKCVLITGAGGSIGSELSRQVERFNPARLLLLDHSEFNLYEIDKELRPAADIDRVQPLLLDIKDRSLLEKVFERHRPDVVFHAAAYKHVHLVEANPAPAILNNILGTKNLVELCEKYNTERFVLISTDKAVNPIGVMGATKRICELITGEAGFRTRRLFSSVRFGNVLGSSGSLIPLLKSQIEDGGPVTLTHPDMSRYFMLIPEAVSLVLMSSSLSRPGDINVLRMGDPLKIVDVAKSLMALMGYSQDEVPIVFTGIRPGEKMFEELYLTGKELETRHPDILTVPNGDSDSSDGVTLLCSVIQLIRKAEISSADCVRDLHAMVDGGQIGPKPVLLTKTRPELVADTDTAADS